MIGNGTSSTYTYDANNRLLKSITEEGSTTTTADYYYDHNGNQITKAVNVTTPQSGVAAYFMSQETNSYLSMYEYDSYNRLKSADTDGTVTTYTYDGNNLRQSKTSNGITTQHVWDGSNMVMDGTNKFYRGATGIEFATLNGNTSFYHKDAHGDVTALTDSAGTITQSYIYDAFGNQMNENENDVNPFRYCGEYLDSETGLTYLRNRYYDNAIGRFITEDPIKDGLNWYVYCGNNPVMFVDPWGLENIVVSGSAYHSGEGAYQFEFVDSALLQISNMDDATLLVANAGWSHQQYDAIVQAAVDRGINLLWFSSIDSLISYINEGRDRNSDPITSFYVFAHGTDSGTGKYAITFGLYTDKDEQLRLYTSDISKINRTAFAGASVSTFYACRTGNEFNNGNFARSWAWITGGKTFAYSGKNGRSEYSYILGTVYERHVKTKAWIQWDKKRGDRAVKPGEAFRLPKADVFSSMKCFYPMVISTG